jgi:hypothetical protein
MNDFLENLRNKSYQTRITILYGTVAVIALIVVGGWVFSLKNNLKSLNQTAQISGATAKPVTVTYASVERAELVGSILKVYFNFNNQTNDILNISALNNIILQINNTTLNPTSITDRQGGKFPAKILSHTQDFGILVFSNFSNDDSNLTLTFDQMFFDQDNADIFKQSIDLNLKKLENPTNLRG